MDPSFPISTDPHNLPPQFAQYPSFASLFGAPAGAVAGNHHVAQAPPTPSQLPPHPTFNHPPYADMIYAAIAALNEPNGSSKQAISRYIQRVYSGLPQAHEALLTHHLKTLKNSGLLVLIKKSYKFASAPALETSRSNVVNSDNQSQSDLTPVVSSTPKRGRGRPPKPKPETLADVQPNAAEPSSVNQSRGQTGSDLNSHPLNLPALEACTFNGPNGDNRSQSDLTPVVSSTLKRGRGRPPKRKPETPVYVQPNAAEPSPVNQSRGHSGSDLNSHQLNLPALEASRFNVLNGDNPSQSDLTPGVSTTPKRGCGRPPKARPETPANVQPNAAEPSSVNQSRGQTGSDLNSHSLNLSAPGSAEETLLVKRRPGRPRKDVLQSPVQVDPSPMIEVAPSPLVVKRRGRPPGRRGPGRPKKARFAHPYAVNGPRRRGRPRKSESVSGEAPIVADSGEARSVAEDGGWTVVSIPSSGKRRGRPPKIGGVSSQPMKPIRRTGRPVGRPRKNVSSAAVEASEPQATAAYEELKRKLETFQEKVSQIVDLLRAQVASDNHDAMSAINELEALVDTNINDSQAQEPHKPQSEAEGQAAGEPQAEAEAIQALF